MVTIINTVPSLIARIKELETALREAIESLGDGEVWGAALPQWERVLAGKETR